MQAMQAKNKTAYHWLIVACCCGLMVCALGISVNCSGVFYIPVAEDIGVGRGDVAMYITIMNLVTGLAGPFVVKYARKAKLRALILIGGLLSVASLASWTWMHQLWQFYVAAFLHGVGNAMLGGVIINMVIGNWFEKRVGLAMGIAFCFSGIAGALFSPVLQSAIDMMGWRSAHLIAAGIAGLSVVPAVLFLHKRPEDKGLLPYGANDAVGEEQPEAALPGSEKPTGRKKVYVFIVCAVGFIGAFLTGMGQHMSGYATSVGLPAATGALMISAVMVGNMSSKLLLGALCDKLGASRAFLIFTAITALGFLLLGVTAGLGAAVLACAAFMIGFSYSLSGMGMTQVTRQVFGMAAYGSVYAYVTVAAQLGSSFSSSLIGYAYDVFGSYMPATLLCLGLTLLALGSMVWMCKDARCLQ